MAHPQRTARSRYLQYFIQEIRNAASCLGASQALILKEYGVRAEQWRALVMINRSPFTQSISALARNLRLTRQSVHSLVLGLERAGWIRLLRNPDDRRLAKCPRGPPSPVSLGVGHHHAWNISGRNAIATMAFEGFDQP